MRTLQKIVWYLIAFAVVVVGLLFGVGNGWTGGGLGSQTPTTPRGQSPVSPRDQTPVSPREQTPTTPVVQTPTTPVPEAPPAPQPAPRAAIKAKPKAQPLDLAKMKDLKAGMSVEEVKELLGQPGFLMSQTGDETTVYRWSEPGGAAVLARFKDGKLERKNLVNAKGAEAEDAPELTRAQYDSLTPGMALPEVLVLVGINPKSQNENKSGVSLVRWADAKGSSFSVRFEDGKLVRKTGFHVESGATRKMREAADEALNPDDAANSDAAPKAEEDATKQDAKTESPKKSAATKAKKDTKNAKEDRKSRVHVAGGKNDKEESSYMPKAKLPSFAHGLREGSFEIRIDNPSEHDIQAGLRAANRGIDIDVPAKSQRSIKVDRGTYSFFFVSDSDPYTLNGGNGVSLNSMFSTDLEISIVDEDYEVRPLDDGR